MRGLTEEDVLTERIKMMAGGNTVDSGDIANRRTSVIQEGR
jgi:hypothetical protein